MRLELVKMEEKISGDEGEVSLSLSTYLSLSIYLSVRGSGAHQARILRVSEICHLTVLLQDRFVTGPFYTCFCS